MEWLSRGSDVLIDRILEESGRGGGGVAFLRWDIVIIGSGYGAAVAASRLARAGFRDICLLERGREYLPGEFPNDIGHAPAHIRLDRWNGPARRAREDALFDFRFGNGVVTLTARALGGTSQINANVAMRADPRVFQQDRWPLEFRDEFDPLDAHYTAVEQWLQVDRVAKDNDPAHPGLPEKYQRLEEMRAPVQRALERCWSGVEPRPEATCGPALLAVTMVEPGGGHNPYGVEQHACVGCGDCVTGCNHRAKNTLTMNYLPDAFRHGVEMFTGVNVDHLSYDEHAADGFRYRVFFDETVETVLGRSQRAQPPTDGNGGKRQAGRFEIRARAVIVAGGVLGSTEVLIRSGEGDNGLRTSERLGHFVSLNGDSLAYGYDQRERVNGVGWGSRRISAMRAKAGPYVGPTITGVLDARLGRPLHDGVVIEDGIVPGAIEAVVHEWLTSAGLMAQLGECKVRGESDWRTVDPLAPSERALQHTQTYLVVGHDAANGHIRMRDGAGSYIDWPADATEGIGAQDLLQACENEEVGGIYLDNPVLRPIPKKLSDALAGPAVRGATLSVHPLGGVPMGDDFESGVVNHYGAVYDGKYAQSVYPGLFVLDGSIIPTSLGANPFLTIAAIAERAIPFIVLDLAAANVPRTGSAPDRRARVLGNVGDQYPRVLPPLPQPAPQPYENPNLDDDGSKERDVTLAFRETLRSFADYPAQLPSGPGAAAQPSLEALRTFELRCVDVDGTTSNIKFAKGEAIGAVLALDLGSAGVDRLLADPHHKLAVRSGQLRLARHLPHPPESLDDPLVPFAVLEVVGGQVTLLEPIESGGRWSRILRGVATWQEMRGKDDTAHQHLGRRLLAALTESIRRWSPLPLTDFVWLMFRAVVAILRLAYHAGELRRFHYTLDLRHNESDECYRIDGVKDLRFTLDHTTWQAVQRLVRFYLTGNEARRADKWKTFGNNWWHALLDLRVELKGPQGKYWAPTLAAGTLRLDLVRAAHDNIAQIVSDQRVPDTPRGLLGLARIGLLFFRVMLKVHFWDFKAPEYVSALSARNLRPGRREGIPVPPECILFSVPIDIDWDFKPPAADGRIKPTGGPGLTLHLNCYRAQRREREAPKPILLLHGFAQSSTAFINEDVKEDLVVHLYNEGYDVWLLDYRHSIALQSSREEHDLDKAALNDLPYAIDEILAHYRDRGRGQAVDAVTVFGHCMGAVLVSMAALSGRLQCKHGKGERSRIKAAVLSQVPPFIVGGPMSQFKIDLAAFIRDVLKLKVINLCARGEGSMWLTMADRLFGTFPVGDEVCPHEYNRFDDHMQDGIGTCKRITGIIGRLYRHENLRQETHDRLPDYFGWANIAVFAQIAKFFECERIVNANGANVYATRDNIRSYMHFPVLFLHGKQNVVFDAESARRSHDEFRRANPNARYQLALIEGYAHYDCIVGKNAKADVFGQVTTFLSGSTNAGPAVVTGSKARAVVSETQVMVPQLGPWITGLRASNTGVDVRLKLAPSRDWSVQPADSYVFENSPQPAHRLRDANWDIGNPPALAKSPNPERRAFVQKIRGIDEPVALGAKAVRWTADVITLSGGGPPADLADDGSRLYQQLAARATLLERLAREPELRTAGRVLLSPLALEDALLEIPPELIDAARKQDEIAFFASCCRHPGTGFETLLSDLAFQGMAWRFAQHAADPAARTDPLPQMCLLVGDQIYADAMGGVFDTERPIEKFVQRYYRAFASPNFRALVRRMPLHLTIDDHEIQDNYSHDMMRTDPKVMELAPSGFEAALAFQGIGLDPVNQRDLWYAMQRSCFDFFLLDTRFSRFRKAAYGASTLMDERQWHALESWLGSIAKDRPKFIVSGSVVLPRSLEVLWASKRDAWEGNPWLHRHRPETRWDSWSAFPAERERLFRCIVENRVDNVVFVSGDYHTSSFSKLEIRHGKSKWKAYSVVSPPAYAPFPFANDRADCLATRDTLPLWPGASVDIATRWRHDGSGFAQVHVRPKQGDWSVGARWFDQRGRPRYQPR